MSWGKATYRDRKPVPRRDERCSSERPEARAHLCKLHDGHDEPHECICGEEWGKTKATTG